MLKLIQGVIETEKLVRVKLPRYYSVVERHTNHVTATLLGLLAPRMIDEYATHRFGNRAEKVCSTGPFCVDPVRSEKADERVVYQRSRLEGVTSCFRRKVLLRESPEFTIDKREKLGRARRVAFLDSLK